MQVLVALADYAQSVKLASLLVSAGLEAAAVNDLEGMLEGLRYNPLVFVSGAEFSGLSASEIVGILSLTEEEPVSIFIDIPKEKMVPLLLSGADLCLMSGMELSDLPEIIKKWASQEATRREVEALREKVSRTEEELAFILENIEEAVLRLKDGRIKYLNRYAKLLFGSLSENLKGEKIANLALDDLENLLQIIEAGANTEDLVRFIRKDGQIFHGHVLAKSIGPEEALLVIRDVSQLPDLKVRNERLEILSALINLVDGLAHNLRNPLMVIGGFSRRLIQKIDPKHPFWPYLDTICQQVERIEAFLKESARSVSLLRGEDIQFRQVDLKALVKRNIEQAQKVSLGGEFKFEVFLPQERLYTFGEEGLLERLFWRIIENAMEALTSGGTIRIRSQRERGFICMLIMDSGPGIPQEEVEKIFEPFYTTKPAALGLGLTEAFFITTIHRGLIDICQGELPGACIKICLPESSQQETVHPLGS
ncbi:two-component system sensor histidine kinase NtrB [Thermosulfuriphilus sp.]